MISKIQSHTPNYPARKQEWSTNPSSENNSPKTNTGIQAWGVVKQTEAKVAPAEEKTPSRPETSKATLNPLSYTNTGAELPKAPVPPIAFNPPVLDTPQAIETWNTIQANTFMPVPPSLNGVTLPTATTSANPYGGGSSLGSSVFSNSLGSLGLG